METSFTAVEISLDVNPTWHPLMAELKLVFHENEQNEFNLGDPAKQRTHCLGGSGESVGNVRREGRLGSPPDPTNIALDINGRYDKTHLRKEEPMKPDLTGHFDRAMEEVASQRELFWQPKKRKLKSLPQEWREAIERGEELLRDAQRRKIESNVSFSSPIEGGRERRKKEGKSNES